MKWILIVNFLWINIKRTRRLIFSELAQSEQIPIRKSNIKSQTGKYLSADTLNGTLERLS